MCRFDPARKSFVVVVVMLFLGTMAARGPSEEAEPTARATPRAAAAAYLSLPGFWELRSEDGQKELELSEEQKEGLRKIGQQYYEQTRKDWAEARGLSPEERKKKYDDIYKRNLERMKEVRKQVEGVLSAEQLEHLKQISLRTRGSAALANPRVLQQLEINDAQQKRIRQLREQMQERIRQIRQETLEKTLEVLSQQQRAKLEELIIEGVPASVPRTGGGQ